MTVFEIPTNETLIDELVFRTTGYVSRIRKITSNNYDTYEMRSARRVEKQIKALTTPESDFRLSYGALKELSWYCSEVARYYEDKRCRKVMNDLAMEINNFCEFYSPFLM